MSGAIHPLPQYAFMAWCSVKAQEQLSFSMAYFPFYTIQEYFIVCLMNLISTAVILVLPFASLIRFRFLIKVFLKLEH
jgi:hypothetical protein